MIPGIIADPKYGEIVFRKHWWTVDFADISSLGPQLTSDRPVLCIGGGIEDPKSMIVLPLGPRVVLYITNKAQKQRLLDHGKGWLGLITMQGVLAGAKRFAYGTKASNTNVIEKWLPKPSP